MGVRGVGSFFSRECTRGGVSDLRPTDRRTLVAYALVALDQVLESCHSGSNRFEREAHQDRVALHPALKTIDTRQSTLARLSCDGNGLLGE